MKRVILLFALIVFSINITFAGNLIYKSFNLPKKVTIKDILELSSAKVEYENINGTYAVEDIIFYMSMFDDLTDEELFSISVELLLLGPNNDYEVDFGDGFKEFLTKPGLYRFESSTTQKFDEDPTNNTGTHFLEISDDIPPKGPDIISSQASYFNQAEFIPLNNTQKIMCVFFNSSPTEIAKNVSYTLDIQDSTGKSIHKVVVNSPATLAPYGSAVIDFGPIPKSVFDLIKSDPLNQFPYTIVTSSKCDGDINTTNNTSTVKNSFKLEVSLEDLMKGLQKELDKKGTDARTPGYMHNEKVASGKISSEYGEGEIVINSESYVGWLDIEYGAKFEHKTSLFTYDISSSNLEILDIKTRPMLWNLEGVAINMVDINIVGEEYEIEHAVEGENIYSIGNPTNQDRVCALLISGSTGKDTNMQKAIDRDVTIMKDNLRNEEFGPRLGDENIRTVMGSELEKINAIINEMKGKYDKIYFYFSGNPIFQGYNAFTLLQKLSTIGAKEYNILLDFSYSGNLEKYVKEFINFNDATVTMITSCRNDKVALVDKDPSGFSTTASSYFSKVFGIVYGTKAADLNNDGYTSFEETYKALKIYDKEINKNDLTVKQLPNLIKIEKRVDNKPEKGISFEGAGVEFKNVSNEEFNYNYNVAFEFGYGEYTSTNPKVYKVGGDRSWYIFSDANNGEFDLDIEFKLDKEIDKLDPMMNEMIGMVYRESSTDQWQPQYPSVYDKDKNSITCPNVDHFSQWAAGIISTNPTSVDSKFLINNIEYGPNPFKNLLNFEFNLDKPESFSIEVVDITGRRFEFINTQDYGIGTFSVNLDGSKYPSGTYYCRLISERGIRTIKLLKE